MTTPIHSLLAASAGIQAFLSDGLEGSGITFSQYTVLRILADAGEGGLPTLEVGRRMAERAPGVTRLMDRLAHRGLVARQRDESDRRQVFCRLTESGAQLISSVRERMAEREAAIFASLTRHEQAALTHMLGRVERAISEK